MNPPKPPEPPLPDMRAGIRAFVIRRSLSFRDADGATVLALLCAGACAPVLADRPWQEAVSEIRTVGGYALGKIAEGAFWQFRNQHGDDADPSAAQIEPIFAEEFAAALGGDGGERVADAAVDLLLKLGGLGAALDAAVSRGNGATATAIIDRLILLGSDFGAARRLISQTMLFESMGFEAAVGPGPSSGEPPATATDADGPTPDSGGSAQDSESDGEGPEPERDEPSSSGEESDTDAATSDPKAPTAPGRLRRWIRRRGVVLGVFIGLAACLLLTSALTIAGQLRYNDYRDATMSERLIEASNDVSLTDGPLAQLLAAAAWRIDPTDAAWAAMSRAVNRLATGLFSAGDQASPTTIAYNPDGTSLATAGSDGSVALWDTETWESVLLDVRMDWGVESLEFSPDGLLLAVGGYDEAVMLWDLRTGESIELPFPDDASYLAFDPLGTKLAAAGYFGPATVWDTGTFEEVSTFDAVRTTTGIKFDPDGENVIMSSSDDGRLLEFDAETGAGPEVIDLDPELVEVTGVYTFDIAGNEPHNFLICDLDCLVWGESGGQELEPVTSFNSIYEPVAFTAKGNQVVGTFLDGGLGVWNAASGATVGILPYTGSIHDLAVSPDGRTVVAAVADGVQRWDLTRLGERTETRLTQSMNSIWVNGDWETAVGVGESGSDLWEFQYGGDPIESYPEHVGMSTAMTPDGKVVATALESTEATVELWDTESGESIRTLTGEGGLVSQVVFSEDGAMLAGVMEVPAEGEAEAGQELVFWDWEQGEVRTRISFDAGQSVSFFRFNSEGTEILTLAGDGRAQLWDTGDGSLLGELAPSGSQPYDLQFSPDGSLIAAATSDGIAFWDRAEPESDPAIFDTGFSSSSIAFDADRPYVAVVEDYPVRYEDDRPPRITILDYEIGAGLAALPIGSFFGGFGVSPDGNTVALVESDLVTKFDISYLRGDIHALACEQAGRELTEGEWETYLPELEYGSIDPCG
ncbi:WD40 repeat domain-containing protein [Glycomyces buryatensis]|uniref:WD40 repeat domain-containing protein n=1 Tax=Glycomyces buryatensis TaxID=2570927 RepID=A0A4S8QC19_9ACTN|nr:WD40 repeat domain-containing protein [Glycomyces buryatensis]THV41898.1 WD40 repeat domain-containing protein [Glycomyces buryatensis]